LKKEKIISKKSISKIPFRFFFYLYGCSSKNIRETLKKQIDQRGRLIKNEFENSKLEVKYVIEQDKNILDEDNRKRIEKLKFLTTYRNENKQVFSLNFIQLLFSLMVLCVLWIFSNFSNYGV